MMSANIILYILMTLIWMSLAAFVIIRVPKCKTIPKLAQVFVIIFLLLQIFARGQNLYEVLVKENIVNITSVAKSQVVTDTNTLQNLSKLLMSSHWFNILSFVLMIVLYYIIFRAIYQCNEKVIPPKLIWSFVIVTIILHFVESTARSNVDNKILLNSMAK